MSALQTPTGTSHARQSHVVTRRAPSGHAFDWAGQVKLAVVLSIAVAILTSALAGRVADQVLIVGVIVAASFFAWARIEPVRHPVRVPGHH